MIRKPCIKYDTVVNIARVHISRQKIIHILGSFVHPILVDVTDNSKHRVIDDTYVKVNYDAMMFTTNIGWIVCDLIIIRFRLKNLNIFCVK